MFSKPGSALKLEEREKLTGRPQEIARSLLGCDVGSLFALPSDPGVFVSSLFKKHNCMRESEGRQQDLVDVVFFRRRPGVCLGKGAKKKCPLWREHLRRASTSRIHQANFRKPQVLCLGTRSFQKVLSSRPVARRGGIRFSGKAAPSSGACWGAR